MAIRVLSANGYAAGSEIPGAIVNGGWGIDGCLTTFVTLDEAVWYAKEARVASLRWVRERSLASAGNKRAPTAQQLAVLEQEREAGLLPVLFPGLPDKLPRQSGDALPGNLLEVFRAGGELAAINAGRAVAFELLNEADVGYCRDLPDRVVAYQKALYLGLKAPAKPVAEVAGSEERGASSLSETSSNTSLPSVISHQPSDPTQVSGLKSQPSSAPLVLMGALALPPGPWLERATRNGLLEYADAYNYHFYGWAEDFTGVYRAHRAFLRDNAPRATRPHQVSDVHRPLSTAYRPFLQWHGRPAQPSKLMSGVRHPMSGSMPLWVTECGIDAVDPDDFLNAERRQLQADFTVSTARQALKAKDLAVFMPFILVHKGDPHALTLGPDQPLPAWEAYTEFIREHPWPERPVARVPADPNPLVVQWLADNTTTVPHKVSGTYRFWQDKPIRGELRLYNFSDHPIRGRLELGELKHVQVAAEPPHVRDQTSEIRGRMSEAEQRGEGAASPLFGPLTSDLRSQISDLRRPTSDLRSQPSDIVVPPMGMVSVPVVFRAKTPGYFREFWEAVFVDEGGRRSPVYFGLERWPEPKDFVESPLALSPLGRRGIKYPPLGDFVPGETAGVWTTMNGLRVEAVPPDVRDQTSDGAREARRWPASQTLALERSVRVADAGALRGGGRHKSDIRAQMSEAEQRGEGAASPLFGPPTSDFRSPTSDLRPLTSDLRPLTSGRARFAALAAPRYRFWTEVPENDPLRPMMAVAKVDLLPADGFVRLQLNRPLDKNARVRVDFVDKRGQRFTIWENFGMSYAVRSDEAWLNLADFHIHFWGRCTERPQFRPEDMREIQLRVYLSKPNTPIDVELSLMRAGEG